MTPAASDVPRAGPQCVGQQPPQEDGATAHDGPDQRTEVRNDRAPRSDAGRGDQDEPPDEVGPKRRHAGRQESAERVSDEVDGRLEPLESSDDPFGQLARRERPRKVEKHDRAALGDVGRHARPPPPRAGQAVDADEDRQTPLLAPRSILDHVRRHTSIKQTAESPCSLRGRVGGRGRLSPRRLDLQL